MKSKSTDLAPERKRLWRSTIYKTAAALAIIVVGLLETASATERERRRGSRSPECEEFLDGLGMPCVTRTFRFTQFSAPDVDSTEPWKGNRRGRIVGRVVIGPNQRGMIYDGKRFTIFDVPEATQTQGYGINDAGHVVGLFYDTENRYHGFLRRRNGNITTLDVPGAVGTHATEINNLGQIIGYYEEASGNLTGFLLNDGVYTSLNIPGAIWTIPYGINDVGQIAGWYYANDVFRSFVYEITGNEFRLIDVGAAATVIWGINNAGQMAGFINDDEGEHHGLLIDRGLVTIFDLGSDGETVPFGINDAGQIIGFYDGKGFITESVSKHHVRDKPDGRHIRHLRSILSHRHSIRESE